MASFSIRSLEPEDTPVLREVFRRSSLSNVGDRETLLANPDALELSDVGVGEERTRVATVADGTVVGFATTAVTGSAIELADLFVDPDWMRRGVGRQLVLDVLSVAREEGANRVEVTANPHALGFYEKLGFFFVGTTETRFGPAARMQADIAQPPEWMSRT